MTQTLLDIPCLELTGLLIASPQGFLAALGLLRICTQDLGHNVRLSWAANYARLHGIDWPTLLDGMTTHMRGRSEAPEFNFKVTKDNGSQADVNKLNRIRPADYRAAANSMHDNPRALAFLAAFATDAVVSKSGFVTPNKLDFSAGPQQFVDKIRNLAKRLDPTWEKNTFEVRLHNALIGGHYEKIEKLNFGWDPVTMRRHACEAEAPTDSEPPCQPFSAWFTIEALPLHPVLPVNPRRAVTTGFCENRYVWPQWSEPLTLEEVRLLRQRPVKTLEELEGVQAVWQSVIAKCGRYPTLSTAERTPGYRPETVKFASNTNN